MVIDLTGLSIANASLLDEGTAAAEAMHLCYAVRGGNPADDGHVRTSFFISELCHPQTIAVVRTRAEALGIQIIVGIHTSTKIDNTYFGVLLQYPATNGIIYDYEGFISKAHDSGSLAVVAADPLALTILRAPGEFGADVVVGTTQRFGVPLGFGGPHAAYFATRDEFKRLMPGRLVGVSKDAQGKPAYRLSLQTREQHIRRDKATSNICTAQVLLAVIAAMYASYHGPEGLRRIARRTHILTKALAGGLKKLGYSVDDAPFFDTLRINVTPAQAEEIRSTSNEKEINLRWFSDTCIGISLDETVTAVDLQDIWSIFHHGDVEGFNPEALLKNAGEVDRPVDVENRKSAYLQHPVFNQYHTETEMLRYLKRLESRDLSLTTSMIPLGSCTMKLNASAEMLPLTWPEWGRCIPSRRGPDHGIPIF